MSPSAAPGAWRPTGRSALAAAFLTAVFGFCPGCEMYGLITRFRKNNQQGATA